MRPTAALAAIYLVCVPFVVAAGTDPGDSRQEPATAGAPHFVWYSDDGTVAWDIALDTEEDPVPNDAAAQPRLHARPWFPRLPSLDLELIDGREVALDDFKGTVLLIDFWATWCEPCAEELPWLQQLRDVEGERGLEVLTVNMNEPDELARRFAEALEMRLPIARYGKALDAAFHVRRLPAMLVADREQRIRARIDGYMAGIEQRIADVALRLLEEPPDPGQEIARVLRGGERFEVQWSRKTVAPVRGLAVLLPAGSADSRILAATGRKVTIYETGGDTLRSDDVTFGVDRFGIAGNGPRFLGFRPAGRRVVPLALDGPPADAWEAPAPTLDLRVEPATAGEVPTVLLATTEGLHRVRFEGSPITARTDLGVVLQVRPAADGPLVLDASGRLIWLDTGLATVREREVSPDSRVVASFPALASGFGLGSAAVTAVTAGRVLDDEEPQLALAVEDQLVVLDLDSGRERFRAEWPGVGALAAGDLDGDGRDELIVGSGRRVTALRAVRPVN